MKFFLLASALLMLNPSIFAQNNEVFSGYWKMKNTVNTLVRIVPEGGCVYRMSYSENGLARKFIGTLYNDTYFSFAEENGNALKMIYTGRLNEGNNITGKFFSPECKYGDILWVKVCDDYGNPLGTIGEEYISCVTEPSENRVSLRGEAKKNTASFSQKEVTRVLDRIEYVGEPRNELLPLAETLSEVPPGAILVGNIGLEERPIYRTIETETPIVVSTTPEVCEPVSGKSPADKKKFFYCDEGSLNPMAQRAIPTPGRKIVESGIVYHIVGKNETMFSISRKYGLTIEGLASLNGKDCEHLKEGEKIRVSQ